jgi:two-component system nitrate/nitrite response regulator NarL
MKQLLAADTFRIGGEARSHGEAITQLENGLNTDLILVDVQDTDAVKGTIEALRAAAPNARIVHLTTGVDTRRLRAALEAGADGYLTKDRSAEALTEALRLVMLGEKVFPSDLAALLTQNPTMGVAPNFPHRALSQREEQILRCLVRGESNKQIAIRLNITEATVKVHLKSLLRKIACSNRTQAAIWAMNHGLTGDLVTGIAA